MYVIKTTGKKGILFMADRTKTKRFWWTYAMNLVMKFTSKVEAWKVASRLRYNNAEVISLDEAYKIRENIEKIRESRECYDEGDSEYWDGKDFS